MAQLMDSVITGIILVVATVLALRYLWRLVHPSRHQSGACSACDTRCDKHEICDEVHAKKQAPVSQH